MLPVAASVCCMLCMLCDYAPPYSYSKEFLWGHAIARGWATLLLDRLRDFAVAPSSVGGNSSPLHDSRSVDELATLDRYHHFHGHSGLCA